MLVILLNKHIRRSRRFALRNEQLTESINLLEDENSKELNIQFALLEKIKRYNRLKSIIEDINQGLSLDLIAEHLATIAFSIIGNNKGVCLLYLVDNRTQKLNIFKSKKEDNDLVVKAKEGDIFDFWILRHASPLFIEDIKKDFRFDSEQVISHYTRPIASLISVPFISENKFLGILRLDSAQSGTYTQDDLRFLVTISELGAVALENGELFQETQELAIHDGLTSLYRKGYFLERLKEEVKKSLRKKIPISLLMLDIDFFKNYNDKFGHTAGDIILKNLSQNMTDALKGKGAIIGRFGGEEFSAILLGIGKKEAMVLAEELRQRIEKNRVILRRQITNVTVSIGVATLPQDANDEVELMIKADRAMYAAKQGGRNRVVAV
jgi:diguanylate cyclase (GGDEF)-like protein